MLKRLLRKKLIRFKNLVLGMLILKKSESLDWTDTEEEREKEGDIKVRKERSDSDDEALENVIA